MHMDKQTSHFLPQPMVYIETSQDDQMDKESLEIATRSDELVNR